MGTFQDEIDKAMKLIRGEQKPAPVQESNVIPFPSYAERWARKYAKPFNDVPPRNAA
jgi:hypothetical protein